MLFSYALHANRRITLIELLCLFRTSLERKMILSLIQDTYEYCSAPMKRQQRPQRPVTRKWHPQSTHRVATATLLRAFHHDGTWWGWGLTPTPFRYIYHRVQSRGVRSIWEGRYTPPISTLPLCVLCSDTPPPFWVFNSIIRNSKVFCWHYLVVSWFYQPGSRRVFQ